MTDPRCIVGKLIKARTQMQSISSLHMARGCGGVWGGGVCCCFFQDISRCYDILWSFRAVRKLINLITLTTMK